MTVAQKAFHGKSHCRNLAFEHKDQNQIEELLALVLHASLDAKEECRAWCCLPHNIQTQQASVWLTVLAILLRAQRSWPVLFSIGCVTTSVMVRVAF